MAWSLWRRDPQRAPRVERGSILALAAWCGLLAGLLEVLTKVVCAAVGRSGRLYLMSRHFVWLIPLTNLAVFLILGLFLAGLARVFPRFGRWFSLRCLAALVVLPSFLVAAPEIHGLAWTIFAWGLALPLVPVLERLRWAFVEQWRTAFPS